MNQIYQQVQRARRRLLLQRFGHFVSWTLFVALLVALVAIAVPKIWPLDVTLESWAVAWAGGGFAAGLLLAVILTLVTRPSLEQTAAEIDHRFDLRERLSSSLMLDVQARDTEAGRALLADAERQAGRIAVTERFELRPAKLGLLPLIPLAMLTILLWIPDATQENELQARASFAAREEAKQIKTTTQQLKRKLAQQRRQAKAKGLEDAADLFEKLESKLDKISQRKQVDKKEALIALNDLKKELENRREKLGTPNEMKKAMSNLNKLDDGPADRVANAMEKGDFGEAQKEVQELAKKLRDGKLSDQEKAQLQKQIEQMKQQLEKAAAEQERAKQACKKKLTKPAAKAT
jgi:DNA repair exonuclease SbcCD ATPase subunit